MQQKNALNGKLHTIGWILTISFISMTFVPRSLDDSMFVDGLAYAAIARNMSHGLGTFWQPYFADSFWLTFNNRCAFFCEHPPLMFGMQSVLFTLFGDNVLVENLYNLLVLLATVILMSGVWRLLFRYSISVRQQSWLPVLMWYCHRVVWWSMPNNLLDSTMAAFCLAAVYLQLKAFDGPMQAIYLLVSACMIVCAGLTKGPVGLYPIAFPVLYTIIYERNLLVAAGLKSLFIFLTVAIIFSLLLLYQPARILLTNYFEGQVIAALLGNREKIGHGLGAHLYLARLLFVNIIPHITLFVGLILIGKKLKIETTISRNVGKSGALALLTSALIILPISASVKQADYYLMPALPFVGMCIAAISVNVILGLYSKIPVVFSAGIFSIAVLLAGVMMYQLAHKEPDHMYAISCDLARIVPAGSKVYLPSPIAMYSEIHTPFQRYARLSIAFDPKETSYLYFDGKDRNVLDSLRKTKKYMLIDLSYGASLAVRDH